MAKALNTTRRAFLSRLPAAVAAVSTLTACAAVPVVAAEQEAEALDEIASALVAHLRARGFKGAILCTADDYTFRPLPGVRYAVLSA